MKCDIKRKRTNKSDPNTHITGIYVFVCVLVKENPNQFMFATGWWCILKWGFGWGVITSFPLTNNFYYPFFLVLNFLLFLIFFIQWLRLKVFFILFFNFSQLPISAINNYCTVQPDLNPSNDKSVAQKENNIVLQW